MCFVLSKLAFGSKEGKPFRQDVQMNPYQERVGSLCILHRVLRSLALYGWSLTRRIYLARGRTLRYCGRDQVAFDNSNYTVHLESLSERVALMQSNLL